MRKHALHLYLEELETVDSTFSGGHLPGVHSGCGSSVRVGITEAGGKKVLHHECPPFLLSKVAHFLPQMPQTWYPENYVM